MLPDVIILRLKCTKFNFGWGSAPHPLGELTALPRPLAEFQGPTSKGREGRGGVGREREGREREGEGEGPLVLAYTPDVKSWIKPWSFLRLYRTVGGESECPLSLRRPTSENGRTNSL